MRLISTTSENVLKIAAWLKADPWHNKESRHSPEWMLTGNGLLAFCLVDDKGPLCFVRLDKDGELARIAIQFGPDDEVSKRRLIVGLVRMGIPAMAKFAKEAGLKGLVFESINPTLIGFGDRQGFKAVGNNDYVMVFGEETNV